MGGDSGNAADTGRDRCGVCAGTDDCVGCDDVTNSGKTLDACDICLNPTSNQRNKGDPLPSKTTLSVNKKR